MEGRLTTGRSGGGGGGGGGGGKRQKIDGDIRDGSEAFGFVADAIDRRRELGVDTSEEGKGGWPKTGKMV
ncbi:hypothetical protein Ancab_028086 [Ancistrocladus abbreviatus]